MVHIVIVYINNPTKMDLDDVVFMTLSLDLLDLIGSIARFANRIIKVRDDHEFDNWLHVISKPVVVKVFAGNTIEEREISKEHILLQLGEFHILTLTKI